MNVNDASTAGRCAQTRAREKTDDDDDDDERD